MMISSARRSTCLADYSATAALSRVLAVTCTTNSNRFSDCEIASENEIHRMSRMRFTHVK
jgi:hypothetical protein